MKRTTYCILAAALLTAGALLTTACSNEDDATIENTTPSVGSETIQFTATLAPKGDDGTTTRAITTGTDANDKEILNVAWTVGEQISVRYELANPGKYVAASELATATVTAVDPTTGTATINAPLNGPKDGTKVEFIYPATLKPDKSTSPETQLLSQHGNLTARTTPNASVDDISTNFDYATGSGTLSVTAGTAVVSSKVTMTNEVCICKFRFEFDDGTGSGMGGIEAPSYTPITINDGDGHTYTIVSDKPDDSTSATSGSYRGFRSTDDIYVALLPISGKTVTFSATRKGSTETYTCTKTNVTLEKGKFYRNLGTTTLVRQ